MFSGAPAAIFDALPHRRSRAFSNKLDKASRRENASKQEIGAAFRFNRNKKSSRDPTVRLVVTHWILGALTGVGCALYLLACDVAHLRTLIMHSDVSLVALVLLFGGFAVTFGGVVTATAVMMIASGEEPAPDPHRHSDSE